MSKAAHVDTVLREYSSSLDNLPFKISRHFSDLRELDAVLGGSIASMNRKMHRLVDALGDESVPNSERLLLLRDVADDSARLKMGNEDKIRLAAAAVEEIRNHVTHSSHLLSQANALNPAIPPLLPPPSTFPHMAALSAGYVPSIPIEEKRKSHKRAAVGEKRRVDDDSYMLGPRREKGKERERVGDRDMERDRGDDREIDGPTPKRKRRVDVDKEKEKERAKETEQARAKEEEARTNTRRRKERKPAEARNASPSPVTSQVAVPVPPKQPPHLVPSSIAPTPARASLASPSPKPTRLKPMPVAEKDVRPKKEDSLDGETLAVVDADAKTDGDGDGDGDGDERTYCICGGVSYGEMIGCDDEECEREWFHLDCVKLEATPAGRWFCDECLARQAKEKGKSKRGARGRGRGRARGK